jgi:hypothetical protein
MAKAKTLQRRKINAYLDIFLKNPEAVLVKNLWRINIATIKHFYPSVTANIDPETLLCLAQDIVYIDRIWRLKTKDFDKENKKILSQKFQLEELGVEMNLSNNVKKLKELN